MLIKQMIVERCNEDMVGLDVFDLDEALEDKTNVVKKKKINI